MENGNASMYMPVTPAYGGAGGDSRGYADARNSYTDGHMDGRSGMYHPMYPGYGYDGRNW